MKKMKYKNENIDEFVISRSGVQIPLPAQNTKGSNLLLPFVLIILTILCHPVMLHACHPECAFFASRCSVYRDSCTGSPAGFFLSLLVFPSPLGVIPSLATNNKIPSPFSLLSSLYHHQVCCIIKRFFINYK